MVPFRLLNRYKLKSTLRTGANNVKNSIFQQKRNSSDLFEPDYLVSMEPDIPVYDCLNIQLKGYDFVLLENYQKYVNKYTKILNINVDDAWATPAQKLKVQRFKPKSTVVESEYALSVFERNVQITDVPSTKFSILVRIIQETLPEGVSLSIHEGTEEQQEIRYVPDNELLSLKQQLTDMGGPKIKKTK